ncbi:MAG TPA: hypothetical protein VEQ85_08960, partial [Lacipirellulaceae bacterium]|nr:hypothetical protein [Lacipirellulaceae bacterium]
RTYRLPEAVAGATVLLHHGQEEPATLELETIESDDYVGRKSNTTVAQGDLVTAEISYGIYHGMLLDYYAKHISDPARAESAARLKLDVTPKFTDGGVEATVRWDGKPAPRAAVTLIDGAGTRTEREADAAGVARFEKPAPGLLGLLAGRTDNDAKGEVDGAKYTGAAAYATVTVLYTGEGGVDGGAMQERAMQERAVEERAVDEGAKQGGALSDVGAAAGEQPAGSPADANNAGLPALPEPVASFGAAASDGWLYVYGGHTGEEHVHSRDNLSNHFRRVKLTGGAWEELPIEAPLQGLPLVAHGGKLYRAGGLSFRNAAGDDPDMHSVADFAAFDPRTGTWTSLAPLPEARSSHDAVVIGDTLYVVGGWTLAGKSEGAWLDTAWSIDLTAPRGAWEQTPAPPFKRRALAVASWNGKLVAVGGMDDSAKVSRRVDALDLAAGTWSELPELPRSPMAGFGVSAWNLGGKLLASGADGVVHQLADDGSAWRPVGKLATGRFFHRLLPASASSLLAVGGASPEEGHLASIELFEPEAPKQ